ncbi:cation-translocating P-type ATPase [Clostridium sp. DJ247]|uniref:heavy metal translocating P-type ATPase n=1 Tax=Clostridium sp. DJ247 TaxID=2726188 RepID=UPI0028BEBD3B|nr:cation-translocating P-type ATPase [Clostridium sp. DJ247]MBC2582163.1 cation-translocating P-type ATPase [Clostridium sp. DJ247]
MNKIKEWIMDDEQRTIVFTVISGLSLFISFFGGLKNIIPFDIAWIAIILCGLPIIKGAIVGLITEFDIRADVLVSIALIASIIIGETFAAGEVAFIMTIGSILEEITARKAQEGLEKIVRLTPRTARIVKDGVETIISAEEVKIGDILRVLPGETVAVDGVIISGQTSINQSVMTGESLPIDKSSGDEVFSGTVNQFGSFDMRATKVGEDSSLQRMIKLVESADASKAKIVRLTDRWATWIVIIALVSALAAWMVTGEIIRGVTILVVFCPCALVLATPTAIMAAIGNATRFGILVRSGDALERLATVKRIAFDKTGTLTYGNPEVVSVETFSSDFSQEDLLKITAVTEKRSEHPLGRAVLRHATALGLNLQEPDDFHMIPGRGVKASVGGKDVLAGNLELLEEHDITVPNEIFSAASLHRNVGCTIIFIAMDKKIIGFIALSDTLRNDAYKMIELIHNKGIKTILLTGDNKQAASNIAEKVGITDIEAELLPENKMTIIDNLQREHSENICMVGDGINDAPALKMAFVSVAMGRIGSDIAIDAADITLVSDDIQRIPYLIQLSKKTMRKINFNIALAMILNFVAIALAALGILGPVAGALVHNVGSVFVVLNSALLLRGKEQN